MLYSVFNLFVKVVKDGVITLEQAGLRLKKSIGLETNDEYQNTHKKCLTVLVENQTLLLVPVMQDFKKQNKNKTSGLDFLFKLTPDFIYTL